MPRRRGKDSGKGRERGTAPKPYTEMQQSNSRRDQRTAVQQQRDHDPAAIARDDDKMK